MVKGVKKNPKGIIVMHNQRGGRNRIGTSRSRDRNEVHENNGKANVLSQYFSSAH